jgi:hypothetical protein
MYATKRQRFLRIKDTGANWEVRRPDGTILTYEMIYAAAGKTLRWGLKRIASPGDRNPVTYVWWCDPAAIYESKSPECYPSQINYANGRYVVNLFRESRTDKETFATGYLLGVRQYRLRSIQVVVAGSQLRAYQLVYTYSSRTQRSLLKSVRQYGSDDVTSLPATTIRWQNSEQASGFTIAAQLSGYYGLTLDQWQNSDLYNADFNGDGRTDLLLVYKWASTYAQTQAYLLLAKPGGGFQTVRNITNLYGMSQARWFNVIRPAIADFSGDGRADIQFSYTNDVGAASAGLLTSTPDGDDGHLFASFVDATTKFGMTGTAWNRNYTTVMDYNGDGRADLLVPGTNGQGFAVMRMLAGNKDTTFATAFDFTSEGQMSAGLWQSTSVHAGDFNGDGRSDLLLSHYTGTGFSLYLLTAQEDGHYTRSDITSKLGLTSPDWEGSAWHIADYNGDGRADLLLRRYSTTNDSHLLLATGSDGIDRGGQAGFQAAINVTNLYGMSRSYWGNSEITTGDYNGDGHADLFVKSSYTPGAQNPMLMLYGRAEGFTAAIPVSTSYGMSIEKWSKADYRAGDYNGDGIDDLLVHAYQATATPMQHLMLYGAGQAGDLLSSLENGYGGTTNVSYVPSSTWDNTNNPPVSQTVASVTAATKDGVQNWSAETDYDYEGGAWDGAERRSLGFRTVTTTDPTGAYTTTTYYQGQVLPVGRGREFERLRRLEPPDAADQPERDGALSKSVGALGSTARFR